MDIILIECLKRNYTKNITNAYYKSKFYYFEVYYILLFLAE